MKDKHKQKTPPRWNSRRCVCYEIATGKRREFDSIKKMTAFVGSVPNTFNAGVDTVIHKGDYIIAFIEDEEKAKEKLRNFQQRNSFKAKTAKQKEVPMRIDSRTIIYVKPENATEAYAEQWRQRYYECNPMKRGGK